MNELKDFLKFIEDTKPSAAQLAISESYNGAVTRTLEWVASELRKRIKE